ncbi:alanine racemase [Cesiribacter sp. SM1]|uniref:alanine racemase n=1 Tax=Cesiribacter sp. SM1 TaxID=2861196 RepID=UPI001CD6F5D2|nr:alanine racemase [Cesiribacter sp. SM1]
MTHFSDPSYSVQHTSGIEISRSAFLSNVAFVRQILGPGVKLSAVVKGNAYGHGLEQIAELCQDADIVHLSVFSAQEAQRILKVRRKPLTIMILGMIDNRDLPWAIAHDIEFFVFERDRLNAAVEAARQLGKKARIHLEVETGMNRTGFDEEELEEVLNLLKKQPEELELVSLCTHFAGAEEMANYLRIRQQLETYNRLYDKVTEAGLQPPLRHTACSAASLNYPETRMDLVRIGIMLYGFWPNLETRIMYMRHNPEQPDPLRRLICWKSRILSIKKVKMGEYIGYGNSYLASKDMVIATVPVGYAYGFSRSLSNVGRVLVHGERVAVVGVVNMNLIMINVTEIRQIRKDDEVVLIGSQGNKNISVSSFSEMSQQLNYEMLSRLPADIPRTITD